MNTPRDERILEQLAETANAGVSLAAGLRAAAAEAGRSRLSQSMLRIAEQLDQGTPVEEAVSPELGSQNAHVPAAIRAGIQSDRLGEVLTDLISHNRFRRRIRRTLWGKLAYPLLLFVFLVLIVVAISKIALPEFTKIFDEFGIDLPFSSRAMVMASKMNFSKLTARLLIVPVLFFGLRLLLGKGNWRLFLSKMPVLGQMFHWSGVAQLARLLRIFVRQGMPIPKALELTAAGVADANIAIATRSVAREVRAGGTLQSVLANSNRIPRSAAVIVGWGEQHDRLPEALELLAEISESRISHRAIWITRIVPPVLFIIIATILGCTLMGLFLPLMNLVTYLS